MDKNSGILLERRLEELERESKEIDEYLEVLRARKGVLEGRVPERHGSEVVEEYMEVYACLLYTSPSPRDLSTSRMPSSA